MERVRHKRVFSGKTFTATLFLVLATAACNQQVARPQAERIAILRFENLGTDATTDWMGRALPEILNTELMGSADAEPISSNRLHVLGQTFGVRPISAPGISAERTLALAAGATRIAYGTYAVRGGHIETQITIEDPRTGKTLQVANSSSASANDVLAAAAGLANQMSRQVQPFGAKSNEALKAWAVSLEAGDNALGGQALEAAIAADPDFGPPYRLLAQLKAQHQDRAGALSLLEQALSRKDRIVPVERARMELEVATLRDDPAGRQRALAQLVKLDPRDPNVLRAQGDTALNGRDYRLAIEAYRKAVEVEPENVQTWNQLGYAAGYMGDVNAALGALKHYQSLRPAEPDPIDSQGDVQLLNGHLREAEELYIEAAKKSPGFPNAPDLFKAAMARLMTGDVPGADGIYKQLSDARKAAHDPTAGFFDAEWSWVTGRRKRGYQEMSAFAASVAGGPLKEAAARAYAELALWSLFLGDRAAADEMVKKAVPLAGPSSAALVVVARFLAQPQASAAEWTERSERQFPNPNQGALRQTSLVYALLLAKEFQAAAPILKQQYERNGPGGDEGSRLPLAWCWMESGKQQDASPLLRLNPIPQLTGSGPLISLFFPRVYYLRALDAEKAGRAEKASANYRLFLQLSGPDALVWGEEAKAQNAR